VEGEERLGAALEPQAVAAPLQPSIGKDARALFAAQKRVSALVLFPVSTTKWRARALDHKDSRVRHERRDTKLLETSLLRGRFLEPLGLFIHACM
jgi:hypothetical protein